MADRDMAADDGGLGTFVGRVRGGLSEQDRAWVESTSDTIEALRADLVELADRLSVVAQALDPRVAAGPFDFADPSLTSWEQLVAWADEVNADLVELAAHQRVSQAAPSNAGLDQEAMAGSDPMVHLGRALQASRGEQLVDELLMAGVLVAPPATTGSIAFADHGAWDIEFIGAGGVTTGRADVVITGDPDEVVEHLANRPGVDLIYTTSDAARGLVGRPEVAVRRPGAAWPTEPGAVVVVDIGTDSAALRSELTSAMRGAGSSESVDALLEAVPVLALLVVGARTAARAATTTDAGADVATEAWEQTKDVVASAGVSGLVGWASGMNLLKVPATLTFSLGRTAVRDARRTVELSQRRVARARRLFAAVGHPEDQ